LQYFEVQGISPAPNPIMVPANVMARGSMCITRGRGSAEVLATWSQGDSIRVLPLNAPGAPDLTISATAAAPFENPVAARLGSGVLVVWEKPPSYTSIGAAFVDDSAPTTAVPVNLRSGNELLRHPTVSAAPGGPALVVWQEFDSSPGVGATRVRARLVFPADGGAVDAGEADAGQLPGLDGGAARGVMLVFEPTCGCSGTGAKALLLLVAGLMTRRRARRVRS